MAILAKSIQKIRSIRLMWKLLIPFLFLSFSVNGLMAYIGLTSQQRMIKQEEREEILNFYHLFIGKMNSTKKQALSLASTFAENARVRRLMANCDRQGLIDFLLPIYQTLKKEFEIAQFHFHTPDGKSFLRLHMLEQFGESLIYRKTILEAEKTGKGVAGLERGLAGLGIRGIAPIFYKDKFVGTVEIGYPFGEDFLQDLKINWGPDFTVYDKTNDHFYSCLATTLKYCDELRLVHYIKDQDVKDPTVVISPPKYPDKSFTLGPIRNYSGEIVALVKIEQDRSEIISRLNNTRNLMGLVGLGGIFFSFVVVWVVAAQFTRPIRDIVKVAQEIAEEKREVHLERKSEDEIGILTKSLNSMLESLKRRRKQIEDYAKTLEKKVEERTSDLVASEEKYRTLIEHLPLVVYRLLKDGTVELINPYFIKKLGYSVEEVRVDNTFWWKNIYGQDGVDHKDFLSTFGEDGKEYRAERVVRDKEGNLLTFIDRMIPMKDDLGMIKWVDGIMVDITELKKLQERALQTEEIRLLGEISARFAHEIRNPLAVIGGFARRLCDSLPKDEKNSNLARIIVEEVSRLEQILRIMLSSIQPFTLSISEFDLNQLLLSVLNELTDMIKRKRIHLEENLSPRLPKINCDEGLISRAFESLIRNALLSTPEDERLVLSTTLEDDHLIVIIRHREYGLSEEDLEHFFFPRFTNHTDTSSENLPLSRVIIYRHGGKMDVSLEDKNMIVIRIELPISQHD